MTKPITLKAGQGLKVRCDKDSCNVSTVICGLRLDLESCTAQLEQCEKDKREALELNAVRFQRMQDLLKDTPYYSEFCSIVANGTSTSLENPYYPLLEIYKQEVSYLKNKLCLCDYKLKIAIEGVGILYSMYNSSYARQLLNRLEGEVEQIERELKQKQAILTEYLNLESNLKKKNEQIQKMKNHVNCDQFGCSTKLCALLQCPCEKWEIKG